jgi:hypothetical protein
VALASAGKALAIMSCGPGSPVTFGDGHRADFATASGQIQLAADILAAVQAVFASLRALRPGPQSRADSGCDREGGGG